MDGWSLPPSLPPPSRARSVHATLAGTARAPGREGGRTDGWSLPPKLVGVEVLGDEAVRSLRHFVLHDDTLAPPRALRLPLRLRFAAAVQGPICLGYGAHVGLGRFGVGLGGG